MNHFFKTINTVIPRRYLYDVAILLMLAVTGLMARRVWYAETKRVVIEHRFFDPNIHEQENPDKFAVRKNDCWQYLSFFTGLIAIMIIFRKEAHAFLGD
ncbi:MAG: hypothetical protein RI957_1933 [Verrucomicrobiota bacterium]|jgi:hypothetical protein